MKHHRRSSPQPSIVNRANNVARSFRDALLTRAALNEGLGELARRLDQLDNNIRARFDSVEMHLETLNRTVRQLHDDDQTRAGERHAYIYELLSSQHQTTWDSARLLHGTLLHRLATIERAVRSNEPSTGYGDADVHSTAIQVRDFLQVPASDDPRSTTVKIGSLVVEIPAWDTVILPWLQEHGEWEPAVAKALSELAAPGAVVLDVGAHVGIFTLALSRLVGPEGRVVAVEADPINARFLRRNILSSHCDNVLALAIAASDRSGSLQLSRSIEDNTGDSRTYDVPTAGQVLEVPAVAMDDVISGPVHLVKIDLQGTDHVAMRGMSRIIDEHRPAIVTEFWPAAIREYGDDPITVLAWFRDLGYSWSAVDSPDLTDQLSDSEVCAVVHSLPTGYVNLVLRPTRHNT